MEEKEKIVLRDGTVYPIENGASENSVQVVLQTVYDFPDVQKKFTKSNLESYKIQNAEGLTCSTKKNKYLVDAVVTERESDVLVTFRLADVDMVQKEIEELKSTVASIQSGQKLQDGAIYDLSQDVNELYGRSE